MFKGKLKSIVLTISVCINIVFISIGAFYLYKYRNYRNFNDSVRIDYYKHNNKVDKNNVDVVFIGNSITEFWAHSHYYFFERNNFRSRGIGGQTSQQTLLRFQQDVVELNPKVVVINAGINDIAEISGEYDVNFTLNTIKSMVHIAKANNIRIVLTSVLPAKEFDFKKEIKDVPMKIEQLNEEIKKYALENKYPYVDYYDLMSDSEGGLLKKYSYDGVHPNGEGYDLMEALILPAIEVVLKK